MIKKIKVIGFDLDNTLYKPNEKINQKIKEYACKKASQILEKPYKFIKQEFDNYFALNQSGSQSLKQLGISNPKELMQEAVENANINLVLKEDNKLERMLTKFSNQYKLFLITSSPEKNALKKLNSLGINFKLFNPRFYANSFYQRENGSVFKYISEINNIKNNQIMFIGDRENIDIIPAKNIGVKTAIVNAESDLADFQLKNIYELEKIL